MAKSILTYFPEKYPPSDIQKTTLECIEREWNRTDVFVVGCPTAVGKTFLGYTIARFAYKEHYCTSSIVMPTNIEVQNWLKHFPKMTTLWKKADYACIEAENNPDCKCLHEGPTKYFCKGCPYLSFQKRAYAMPYGVFNSWIYLSKKLYKRVLIMDESHSLIPLIQDLQAKKLWQHDYHFPVWVNTYGSLLRWVESTNYTEDAKLSILHRELTSGKPRFLVQRGEELFRDEMRECIKLLPIDVSDAPPIMWPSNRVSKIVLMSATMGPTDIRDLGLSNKRVCYITADSPIPPENRPIIYDPVGNMSYQYQASNVPSLVSYIKNILRSNRAKGLIHAPYSLVKQLRPLLEHESRLLFHDHENKDDIYKQFMDSPPALGKVLVASGLYEAVDIKYEAGRWQLICKVPYPSLAEPAIKYRCDQDREWYSWQAVKLILQASGRICRRPDDFGATYILDASFKRLFNDNRGMFPQWWQRALTGLGDENDT